MTDKKYARMERLENQVVVYTAHQKGTLIAREDNILLSFDPKASHKPSDYQSPQTSGRGEYVYKLISHNRLFSTQLNTVSMDDILAGSDAYIIKVPVMLMDLEFLPFECEIVDILRITDKQRTQYGMIRDIHSYSDGFLESPDSDLLEEKIKP